MENDKKENERALSEIKKIKKRTFSSILGIFLVIVIGIGGKVYMDNNRFNDEMMNIVKSDQARKIFEEGLKNLDSKALTTDGTIQSYEVDYNSIEHNPMGGIMNKLIINKNEKLYVRVTLSKNSNNELEESGGGVSRDLRELLDKEIKVDGENR
ncbi:hypothetical protein UAY_00229 [Enterococcus moraviensis ATCC BAA-383]|uniref:DUF1310 family protein n=1 Tax=Enterococcus moraviensis ATCC BAA-383 TaxID=1158609 RepID=R2U2C0_9ENTE|nr:DUF1310 family protein [Enterococcus moraviensis]EOI06887.1 hypothetical protein UAY_00229 [Enterococcus moraviensis ATCC BAA-383]EOT65230.1 hypothetical protein I586_02964 [Enterococcus moraviensis ATCC BAA-383]OJG66612.1 hypothetical protein RV09_GL000965 [Enterococcus moraviensis]